MLVQVEKWVQRGTIELSAGYGLSTTAQSPNWLDLSGKHFVLLGALSAMGPLKVLLALGATVVAVDLDAPRIWEQLLEITRNSSGKLIFPLKQQIVQPHIETQITKGEKVISFSESKNCSEARTAISDACSFF